MTDADLPPEEPFPSDDPSGGSTEGGDESFVDRARGTGVGMEDPNIAGDAEPTELTPRQDPEPSPPE